MIQLNERSLRYIGAIVLGMNDALVEMTGALAGFTIVLGNCKLIALAGFTTGIAATLSMAAAEFLSQEAAQNNKRPWKAALYTGIAYLITVTLLLLPYFVLSDRWWALGFCLLIAAAIIFVFSWGVAKIRGTSYIMSAARMLCISFVVAAIAFGISWLVRYIWGIDI